MSVYRQTVSVSRAVDKDSTNTFAQKSTTRDCYYDNLKFYLMSLVIAGHLINPILQKIGAMDVMYYWMYSFHMPLFVFISGRFTSINSDSILKNIGNQGKKLFFPFCNMTLVYSYVLYVSKDLERFPILVFGAYLWYLVSLFSWRALLPIIMKFRYPLLLAVVLMLASGFVPLGRFLSLARTFSFLPLFVLGYLTKDYDFQSLRTAAVKLVSPLLLVLCALALVLLPHFNEELLHGVACYQELNMEWWQGFIWKTGCLLLAVAMGFSFMMVVSERENKFSKYGEYTLYPYVLHFLFFIPLLEINYFDNFTHPGAVMALMALSIPMTVLLSTKPFRLFVNAVMFLKLKTR